MKKKKITIEKTISRRVILILILAVTLLFLAAYFVVYNITYNETEDYSITMGRVHADLVERNIKKYNIKLSPENNDIPTQLGDYICNEYDIDYAFVVIPDFKKDTITYISASTKKDNFRDEVKKNYIGSTKKGGLSKDEKAVWLGKLYNTCEAFTDYFGHEISVVYRIEDNFGNYALAGIDSSYTDMYLSIIHSFSIIALIIILIVLVIYYLLRHIIKKHVSQPLGAISSGMQAFITDGKKSEVVVPQVKTEEYRMIASAFKEMTANIDSYIENINTLNHEQERQKAEIDIASRIQKGFLNSEIFISYGYKISAMMTPAKSVGGDLYDYLPLDKNRVLITVADVSGKGISAAIFMAMSLMLIRQYAKMEKNPSEILKSVNNALSGSNPALLFTTAFLAIYDKRTKVLTYSNAGHNIPYLINDNVIALNGKAGPLLGYFENEEYPEHTVTLKNGDSIYLYTDGVNETISKNGEFFGDERLINVLEKSRGNDIINTVKSAIKEFGKGVERHDDVTMLTLTVTEVTELNLNADTREFQKIKDIILSLPIERQKRLNLCLAAEECFVNICSYAYENVDTENKTVDFSLSLTDKVVMKFEDLGTPFDPTKAIADPEKYDIDSQVGGLGNYIAMSSVDEMKYNYENGKNILTFTVNLEEK